MDPQPQTPHDRKAPTTGSQQYASGERAVVSRGLVAARVRAIETDSKQATVSTPQSASQDESPARGKPLNRVVRSLKSTPSFQRFNKQPSEHISTSHVNESSLESCLSSYGKWQHSTTSLHSSRTVLPTGLKPSSERKVQSMWDLHTRYSGSPHGGRKRYRDYSNLRRISDGSETVKSEILSPQPVSPYKQPVRVPRESTEDSRFWSETQDEEKLARLIPSPRKSIAEELGDMLDVSQGQDEASTAWATENDNPEYPFPVVRPFEDPSITEAQRSDGGVPVDHKAYSQYLNRKLPGFTQSSSAGGSTATDHGFSLQRMRSRRAIPDNTLESVTESTEHDGIKPPKSFKQRLRASTAASEPQADVPTVNASRRATMPAPSIDPFIDHHVSEATDEGRSILKDFKAYKAQTDSQLSQQDDEITNARAGWDIERQEDHTHSRRSSATSRASSIGISRPLSRAWRRLSTWRLGFGARQNTSAEPSRDRAQGKRTLSRKSTDPQPQQDEFTPHESQLTPPATPLASNPGNFPKGAAGLPTKEPTSTATPAVLYAEKSTRGAAGESSAQSASSATPAALHAGTTQRPFQARAHNESKAPTALPTPNTEEAKEVVREPQSSLQVRPGASLIGKRSNDGLLVTHVENSEDAKNQHHTLQTGSSSPPTVSSPHTEQTELFGQWPEQSQVSSSSGAGSVHSTTPPARPSHPFPFSIYNSPASSKSTSYFGKETAQHEQETNEDQSGERAAETPAAVSSTRMGSLPAFRARASTASSHNPLVTSETADHPKQMASQPEQAAYGSQSVRRAAQTQDEVPPKPMGSLPALSARASTASSLNHAVYSKKGDHPNKMAAQPEQAACESQSVGRAAQTHEGELSIPMGSSPSLSTPLRQPSSGPVSVNPLKLSPPQATTELDTSSPVEWTPSHSQPRRPSVLSRTYSSLADRYQVHDSRAASPAPSTSTIGSASTSAYVSLKPSKSSLRSAAAVRERQSDYELRRYRDVGQRIRRVKVVVSLDGGPDLVVDAEIERDGDGEEGWRVREEVRTREIFEV